MAQEHWQVAPALDDLGTGQFSVALLALNRSRAGIDVGAFADHAGEEVFVGQLRVGVGNGLARDPQLLGQQAAGRQLCASGQTPGFDGATQLLIQLTGQILAAVDHNVKFHTDEAPEAIWRARQITAVA